MYGCESWTIKRAQLRAKCQRLDVFELWCLRRFLRVPWTTRRSNQSILKDTSPEYSLEGLMPKMKLQYFGHLMWRTDSLEETLMLGKIEGRRRRGQQRMRWLDGITDSMDTILSKLWEMVKERGAWHVAVHRVTKSRTFNPGGEIDKKYQVNRASSLLESSKNNPACQWGSESNDPLGLSEPISPNQE